MPVAETRARTDAARRLAQKVLAEAGQTAPPTVLREVFKQIAEKHSIRVKAVEGSDRFDGAQLTEGDNTVIAYNRTKPAVRQRFTLAHELGHCLLGHTRNNKSISLTSKDPAEAEANQFAAELLMPHDQLLADIKAGTQDAPTLASRYEVSEEAIWWRLQGADLLKEIRV